MTAAEQLQQRGASADQAIATALEGAEGQTAKVRVTGGDVREGKVRQASDKGGVRRFQVGRHIVSVDTVVELIDLPTPNGNGGTPALTPEQEDALSDATLGTDATDEAKKTTKPAAKPAAAPKPPAEKVTLTSGKAVTGKTMKIRCAWVEPDKRTKKQQELFDTNFAGVERGKSYEAMVKAAGNGAKKDEHMPDGTERLIKVQDAFQVRFTPENQRKHRNALRRANTAAAKAKREAAKA